MASINATTSSGIVATADNTGQLQLQSAGTTIATISSTGLTMNSGNIVQASGAAPAFSVYNAGTQTLSSATHTKLQFPTKRFDTASAFDNTTNYRFQPLVAGYYQISAGVYFNVATTGLTTLLSAYVNGSLFAEIGRTNSISPTICGSILLYLNGSTDYVEIYGYMQTGNTVGASSATLFWFNGSLVRSA
jgi:hypothetical protein